MLPLIALAGFALSAAGDIAEHAAAKRAAEANRKAVLADYGQRVSDIEARRTQEGEAASLDLANARNTSLVEQGMMQLNFAENGVAGNTATTAQSTLASGFTSYRLTELENLRLTNVALDQQKNGARAQANSRMTADPSLLATGLRLAGDGLHLYNQIKRQKEPTLGG